MKCKEQGDDGYFLDTEVRKIVNDFYKQWKAELYVKPQGILCCKRKPEEKIYDHDAIVLPQLFHAEVVSARMMIKAIRVWIKSLPGSSSASFSLD